LNILIYSRAFAPSVGGIEVMARLLAEEFAALGHQTTVVTATPASTEPAQTFRVLRRPPPFEMIAQVRRADVVLHMNVSLKAMWPFLFFRRRWVIAHGAQYRSCGGESGLRDRLKRWIARFGTNVSCSRAILSDLPAGSVVIWNAYDDRVFRDMGMARTRDLLFVGRLVSDKGVDVLLEALALMQGAGSRHSLTVVGAGPERDRLRELFRRKALEAQVDFAGELEPVEVARLMNVHRVLVVPSRVEPFGIVALEGIACGCRVVAARVGGLPEAVGACGALFESGDAEGLRRALEQALRAGPDEASRTARAAHLARFQRRHVADEYLRVMQPARGRVP
jgi:glycosyltransferase involved in cell wall biosynthesis